MNAVELALHTRGTADFITADPTTITLIPTITIFVGGSRRVSDGSPRDDQDFKFIYPGGDINVTTSDGTTRKCDFILVGMPDAEVAIGDHWKDDDTGQIYRIEEVMPFNGYEVKAKGVTIGGAPQRG